MVVNGLGGEMEDDRVAWEWCGGKLGVVAGEKVNLWCQIGTRGVGTKGFECVVGCVRCVKEPVQWSLHVDGFVGIGTIPSSLICGGCWGFK